MTQGETRGNLEDSLQEMLLRALSARLGEATIEEGCRLFAVTDGCGGGKCEREGLLNYDVGPANATMSHRTDILLTRADGRVIAVEVKVGTITDAFKSRGYDMLHLKQHCGNRLSSVLVYAHLPGSGIRIEQAKRICYMFDRVVGRDIRTADDYVELVRAACDAVEDLARESGGPNGAGAG